MLLKNRLTVLWNAGIGGNTTAQMLARVDADVIARNPTWCSVMGGINDVSTLTAAQTVVNLQAIYQKLRNAGIRVIAHTITPLTTGHANFTAANTQKIMEINSRIRQECKLYPDMVLVDSHAALVDPNSATGVARTGVIATDNIHPSAKGSRLIGEAFANAVGGFIPANVTSVSSAADNRGVNAASTNLWPALPSTATGGTLAGTATGAPPSGFKVMSNAGSPTVAGSAVARTLAADGDDFGYNCRMEFTPAAANDAARITQASSGWASTVAAGKAYVLEASINVSGVAGSNLSKFYAQVQFVVDGVNYFAYFMQPSNTTFTDKDFQGVIRSVPFVLTGAAATNIVVSVDAIASAAGSKVTIDMGRVSVRELTAAEATAY
jgi:lysophospholipase L1-like esterase